MNVAGFIVALCVVPSIIIFFLIAIICSIVGKPIFKFMPKSQIKPLSKWGKVVAIIFAVIFDAIIIVLSIVMYRTWDILQSSDVVLAVYSVFLSMLLFCINTLFVVLIFGDMLSKNQYKQ